MKEDMASKFVRNVLLKYSCILTFPIFSISVNPLSTKLGTFPISLVMSPFSIVYVVISWVHQNVMYEMISNIKAFPIHDTHWNTKLSQSECD